MNTDLSLHRDTAITRTIGASVLVAVATLAADLSVPLGVAGAVPYVAVVLLALRLPIPRHTVFAAAICSVLTLLGLVFSPPGGVLWVALVNRSLALFAIWATALLGLQWKLAEQMARRQESWLDETQRAAAVGSWQWDIQTGGMRWSNRTYHLLGLHPDTTEPTEDVFFQHVHPEDHQLLRQHLDQLAKGSTTLGAGVEYRVALPEGATRHVHLRRSMMERDDSGRLYSLHGTVTDITEHKLIEGKLAELEASYHTLFEQSADGILVIDPTSTKPIYHNEAMARMLGYTTEEFSELSIFDIEGTETPEEIRKHIARVLREGADQFQTKLRASDGQLRTILANVRTITLAGKTHLLTTVRDITEDQQTKRHIRLLETVMARMGEAAVITDLDIKILHVNDAYSRMTGYTLDDVRGRSPKMLHGEKTDSYQTQRIRKALNDGEPIRVELINYRKDGSEFWVELAIGPLTDDSGRIVNWISVQRDITQRKRAEQALQESEQRFRLAFESAGLGMALVESSGSFLKVNQALCEMIGYGEEELLATDLQSITHPDDRSDNWDLSQKLFAGEIQSFQLEQRYIHSAGHVVWVLFNASVARDADGRTLYGIGQAQEITERKNAEEALRVSEERFFKAFRSSPDSITITGLADGRIVEANQGFERLTGYRVQDAIGKTAIELQVWPKPEDRSRMTDMLESDGRVRDFELTYRHKSGEFRQALMSAEIIEVSGQRCIVVVARDVTEQKQTDRELRQTLSVLTATLESTADGIVVVDTTGKLLRHNQRLADMWRIPRSSLENADRNEILDHVKDQLIDPEGFIDRANELHAHPDMEAVDLLDLEDGRIFERYSHPMRVGDKIVGRVASYRDVTARKRAETDLRASRQRLRNLVARLQAIREEERTAIAREIHDELGQALTNLNMDVMWLAESLSASETAVQDRCRSMTTLVNGSIETIRDLSGRLRPAVLDEFGAIGAAKWLVRDFSTRSRIECVTDIMPGELELDDDQKTNVFRILQEALTNVTRHAEASRVEITLKTKGEHLLLTVTDNGRGISEDQTTSDHSIGLVGMRERAGGLGGRVVIQPNPTGGTTVEARIPLAPSI
jgi:PAS domain S-box-containing protein